MPVANPIRSRTSLVSRDISPPRWVMSSSSSVSFCTVSESSGQRDEYVARNYLVPPVKRAATFLLQTCRLLLFGVTVHEGGELEPLDVSSIDEISRRIVACEYNSIQGFTLDCIMFCNTLIFTLLNTHTHMNLLLHDGYYLRQIS